MKFPLEPNIIIDVRNAIGSPSKNLLSACASDRRCARVNVRTHVDVCVSVCVVPKKKKKLRIGDTQLRDDAREAATLRRP